MENANRPDWRHIAYRLWGLLDDIDTAGDIAKADDAAFRRLADERHARRFDLVDAGQVEALYGDYGAREDDILGA